MTHEIDLVELGDSISATHRTEGHELVAYVRQFGDVNTNLQLLDRMGLTYDADRSIPALKGIMDIREKLGIKPINAQE